MLSKSGYCEARYLFGLAVRLPRFVMRQDVFLRLAVKNVDVVISQVDRLYPVTGVVDEYIVGLGMATNTASNQC